MKKVIASILVTILASAGYVFIDKSIESRVSNLEVSCSSLQAEVDKYHPQTLTDPTNPTAPTEPITVPTTLGPWSDYPLPASGWCGDYVSWNLDEEGNLTIDGHGKMYDGEQQWDKYKYQVKTISIGDGVVNIGDSVFGDFYYLKSVSLGSSIRSIGSNSFVRCKNLTAIALPKSLVSIGSYAFGYCKIKSISFSTAFESIEQGAFMDCTELETVLFDGHVQEIGYAAFSGCTSLKAIDIPADIRSIRDRAFYGCSNLSSVTIRGNQLERIQTRTFKDCSSLTSIILPKSITSIDNMAFAGCRALKDVFFTGTESEWKAILIGDNNALLTDATIHYDYIA